jgi:hypothetical protein
MVHPSGNPHYPQLWETFKKESLMGAPDTEVCRGIKLSKMIMALKSYYARLGGIDGDIQLDCLDITTAAVAWRDSVVFSSKMNREIKGLRTRAGNIVMFEAGRRQRRSNWYGRKISFRKISVA